MTRYAPLLFTALLLNACLPGQAPEEATEDHHDEEEGVVRLSETAQGNARLTVTALAQGTTSADATVPARITLDPRREARVAAVTAGTLERILVRPGDHVKASEALATVQSPELGTAIGAHLSASARLEAARARRERIEALKAGGFSSAAEAAEAEASFTVAAADAEAAEERLRVFGVAPERVRPRDGEHFSSRFSVKSPIDGEVLGITASLGGSVASGESLFHIGNLDEVWLILDLYERNLADVSVGAEVSFTTDAYGDERFTGTVDQISGWLDPSSRTAELRVVVPNPGHRLKPNMFAKAQLALNNGPDIQALTLPTSAIQLVEGRPSAFIEREPGTYQAVTVETTPLSNGRLKVLSGLKDGDRVVTEGAFTLASELAKAEMGGHHDH